MSLDVMLHKDGEEVFWRNITHNLTKMADQADLYVPLWRPEENNVSHARDLVPLLESGLAKLGCEK